jgi:integrase
MRRRGNGEGSVYYRASRGDWVVQLPRDASGKRHQLYGNKTKQAAQSALRKVLNDQDQGLPLLDRRTTVAALCQTWLDRRKAADRSANTLHNDDWAIDTWIVPHLGQLHAADLTPEQVDKLLSTMATNGLARSSVNRVRNILVRILDDAVKRGKLFRNVARLSEIPRCKDPVERQALTAEQARALLAAATGYRQYALVATALYLGLRPGEAAGLLWSDVDLKRRELSISGSLKHDGGSLYRGDVKRSRAGERTIDMPPQLVPILKEHMTSQAKERLRAGEAWIDQGFVFTTSVGTPLDPSNLRKTLARISAAAGLHRVLTYELRHSTASLLLENGATVEQVADLLGNLPMTVHRHYRHRLRPTVSIASEQMGSLLAEPGRGRRGTPRKAPPQNGGQLGGHSSTA